MSDPYGVIGVDVGGTKTHLARGVAGAVESEFVVPSASWRTGWTTGDATELAALIRRRWGPEALLAPIGLGVHGCDSTQQCLAFRRAMDTVTGGSCRVVNDAELMPWAARRVGAMGLVAGTGSIAVARDATGELITAGGWGFLLGDEGSAAGIVREATRAALRELDLGRGHDPLVTGLLAAYDVPDGAELAAAVTATATALDWGRQAEVVFEAIELGSTVAARVVDGAALALAGLVSRLRARGVTARELVAGGGVLVAQPSLRLAFQAAMARTVPDVTVHILDVAPVVGAIALAGSESTATMRTGRLP